MAKTKDDQKKERKGVASEVKKQKLKKRREKKIQRHGVIYIKHIPHGFYEEEMKGFFSQFGKVMRVSVARSSKTGNSRGYGYIQFADHDVAKIAAETMNNYLMFEKIVKCSLLPPELVTLATFANAGRRPGVRCPGRDATATAVQQLNDAGASREQQRRSVRRRGAAHRRTLAKLAELGVQYDIEGGIVQEVGPPSKPEAAASDESEEETLEVMKVDPDDDEITFKTPPNTIKKLAKLPGGASSATASPALAGKVGSAGKAKGNSAKKLAAKETSAKKAAVKDTPAKKATVKNTPAKKPSAKKLTPAKKSSPVEISPPQSKSEKKGKQKPMPIKVSPGKMQKLARASAKGASVGKFSAKKSTPAKSPKTLALSSGKKRLK